MSLLEYPEMLVYFDKLFVADATNAEITSAVNDLEKRLQGEILTKTGVYELLAKSWYVSTGSNPSLWSPELLCAIQVTLQRQRFGGGRERLELISEIPGVSRPIATTIWEGGGK